MKKILAFTLAETLIVMGIIGVVSALTLPNLNSSTGDKEKIAKVKKIYRDLTDALGRAEAVYGPMDEWATSGTDQNTQVKIQGERITEFMKLSKNCGTTANQGCFSKKNTTFWNDSSGAYGRLALDTDTYSYRVISADGTSIMFKNIGDVGGFQIYIDIDGPNKGPNIFAKDIFSFDFYDRELHPDIRPGTNLTTRTVNECFYPGYCSNWVIQNDNMDYLKADKSGKCKNNTSIQLSENVISCK